MCAATFDFAAERAFIETSEDPHQILDWMGEYRQHARDAAADDDGTLEQEFDELVEFAADRVVELKAARLGPMPKGRVQTDEGACAPQPERVAPERQAAPVTQVAQTVRAPKVDPDDAGRRESARRRAAEQEAARAATEAADEQDRADQEELRQLQERAAKAKARRDAALAATARIEADAKRAAAESERARREQAKRKAAQEVEDSERAAADAETAARAAAATAAKAKSPAGPASAPARAVANGAAGRASAASVAELTPLGMLFREQLAEVAAGISAPRPFTTPTVASPPPRKADATPSQPALARATPAAAASKATTSALPLAPPDPIDALPPLTGADLTSYRTWLGVSQRALAIKFAVEQSVISKSEGKPTTVLPPQLRKALHQAMGEPRPDVGGAP